MKMISADGKLPQLVRLNRKVPNGYVLTTYKISENKFITYRDNKPIAWSSTEIGALQLHEMYFRIYKKRYH